jgi:hypothetical protein
LVPTLCNADNPVITIGSLHPMPNDAAGSAPQLYNLYPTIPMDT